MVESNVENELWRAVELLTARVAQLEIREGKPKKELGVGLRWHLYFKDEDEPMRKLGEIVAVALLDFDEKFSEQIVTVEEVGEKGNWKGIRILFPTLRAKI